MFALGPMHALLKDRLGLVELELGLEVVEVVGEAAAVGTASSISKVEWFIDHFFAGVAPIGERMSA